ncbi:unnamed protein product [Phytophthora lilii]|uniref:Unnamed protein product n=1 Tax=Phytophthora lilii TaxID=2077276 RepID=A0A9W6TWL2_9STRA|nr:unnamed protein product [Phytophthora lilii]
MDLAVDLNPGEPRGYWKQHDPDQWFKPVDGERIPDPPRVNEYRRSGDMMPTDLLPRESRGYWKHHAPGKWFRNINNEKAILLLDNGAEVSILDTTFARKVGSYIDTS